MGCTTRVRYGIILCLLVGLVGFYFLRHAQAQGATIVVRVVGNTFEIIKTVQDGRKVLRFGYDVLVKKIIYDRLYVGFEDGRLDLEELTVENLPSWNWIKRKRLTKSELTFQWKMVHFLESRGLREDKNTILRSLKQALFAETQAAEAGNYDKAFFNSIKDQRRAFIRLRKQLGSSTTSPPSPWEPKKPSVSFSANPVEINKFEFSTLVWNARNADYCKISGGTSGRFGTNDSLLVYPKKTTTYAITCVGPGGYTTRLATVHVTESNAGAGKGTNPSPGQKTQTPGNGG